MLILHEIMPSIYYITGIIYFLFFTYVFSNNVKYSNKSFFCLTTLALSACSFALSGLFKADEQEKALLYLGVVLVSLVLSIIFELKMILVNCSTRFKLDNVIIGLLAAVAVAIPFFIYFFSVNSDICSLIYIKENGMFSLCADMQVYKYIYVSVVLLSIGYSIFRVIKNYTSEFLVKNREFYKNIITIVIAQGLIVAIDVVYKLIEDINLPLISVISLLFLAGYGVLKYSKIEDLAANKDIDTELYIVELPKKRELYSVVSFLIMSLAFIGHGSNYLFIHRYGLKFDIAMAYCILAGAVVVFIQQRGKGILVDVISNLLWASVLPMAFSSFPYFSSAVLLIIPCIFALLGCIYIDRIFIILFGVSGLLTYMLVIAYDFQAEAVVSHTELIVRVGIFAAMIYIILAVHKSFVFRIKQLRRHEYFQSAVVNLSQWLVLSKEMDISYRMEEALKTIMEFTQSDRVFFYKISADGTMFTLDSFVEVDDHGLAKLPQTVKMHALSDRVQHLLKGNVIEFNQKREREYQFLQLEAISTVYIPMSHKDQVLGMLCIQSHADRNYSNNDKKLFKIITNMLSNAIMSTEADRIIEYTSNYDTLTHLPNRSYFTDILNFKIEQALEDDSKLIIVFVDLDSFQEINDLLGHDHGDKILIEVADRINAALEDTAIVSRFGGDEFLVMFNEDIEIEEIEKLMELLMSLFVKPFIVNDNESYLSISCGIAIFPFDGSDGKTLLKNADMAMNEAKITGKNRYVFCSDQMKHNIQRRALLIKSLRKALMNGEFKLVFQPQVDSRTHKIKGAEALLRWFPTNNDSLGHIVSPGEFIPILEETGMIIEVGRYVVEEAVRVAGAINKLGMDNIVIALNMSVEQCKDLGIVEFLADQIGRRDIEPRLIDVEVTESAYADAQDSVRFLIDEMIKLGVSISIDDFGTGYSNMSRLSRISIDKIKIDISYVRGIGVSEKDEGIVVTIINLARSLGCITLAEGVETEEQLTFLAEKGCELIQGYYFYKPLAEEEFIDLLRRENNL